MWNRYFIRNDPEWNATFETRAWKLGAQFVDNVIRLAVWLITIILRRFTNDMINAIPRVRKFFHRRIQNCDFAHDLM